jgi:DNA repair photolyase
MADVALRQRGGVQYRELATRSLLNRCTSPRMQATWSVNPYRGCAMGCRYCYATYTHEFMGIDRAEDFHTTVFVKTGGEQRTAQQLASLVRRGREIALGTATDPYQPAEAEARVTRRFLELVAQHRGAQIGIVTKGALILRDVELLQRIHARSSLTIHVSLISTNALLLRRIEPWAPPPEVRLEMIRRLADAGLDVRLALAPVLPALTDDEASLSALVRAAAGAGARGFFCQVLFLRSPTREKYLRWLAAEHPRYLEAYLNAYAGRVYLTGPYRARIQERVRRLAQQHGLPRSRGAADAPPAPAEQLKLF